MAIHIALAGNPNCGKTTMFNALTGANQYVGNWPGVTVEKKTGKLKESKTGEEVNITDLPGIYSLSPYTLEEVVSRDFILNEKPDVIIDLVDATNIERNLYLTTQLLETGIPVVLALNMADLMRKMTSGLMWRHYQRSWAARLLRRPLSGRRALRKWWKRRSARQRRRRNLNFVPSLTTGLSREWNRLNPNFPQACRKVKKVVCHQAAGTG